MIPAMLFVYVKLPFGAQPYYVAVYQGNNKLGESYDTALGYEY